MARTISVFRPGERLTNQSGPTLPTGLNRAPTLAIVTGTIILLAFSISPVSAGVPQQLQITVVASSPVYAGQTVQITATVQLNNGTAVGSKASFTGSKVYYPNGTTSVTLSSPTIVVPQLVKWTYTLPANAPDGLYSVLIRVTLAKTNSTWGLGSFTVNSQIASKTGLNSLATQLGTLSSQLTGLTTGLANLSSNMKGNFTAVQDAVSADYTALSSGISGVKTSVDGLSASMSGNFTRMFGMLDTISGAIGNLATSGSVSDLKSTVTSGFSSINSALGNLATSAQSTGLRDAVQTLGNQATNIFSVQTYVLLPILVAALVIVLILLLRKRTQ